LRRLAGWDLGDIHRGCPIVQCDGPGPASPCSETDERGIGTLALARIERVTCEKLGAVVVAQIPGATCAGQRIRGTRNIVAIPV
jgi:hypothetical protein